MRKAFFNGEVDKYSWVDIGSSFLPSELIAAFLFAQLDSLDQIQQTRKQIWNTYFQKLKKLEGLGKIKLPIIPDYASNNAHMFYLLCADNETRDALISHLKEKHIHAVFHYLSLHQSTYFQNKKGNRTLSMSDHFSECLIRLPFYNDLTQEDQERVIEEIFAFFI